MVVNGRASGRGGSGAVSDVQKYRVADLWRHCNRVGGLVARDRRTSSARTRLLLVAGRHENCVRHLIRKAGSAELGAVRCRER